MTRTGTLIAGLCLLSLWACGDDDTPADAGMAGNQDAATGDGDGFDRADYADVGTGGPLDYADMGMWACHPDHPANECHSDLDATLIKSDGSQEVVRHERATDPEFDCFYVYPTVLLNGDPNMTDFSQAGIDMVRDPLLSQAARFTRLCEVYAPLYRQFGLQNGMLVEGADRELGLQDVRDAFANYLEHHNQGRKFVLIGHSQGTFVLTSLIQMDIDDVPDVRDRMLSAVLLGGRVEVPVGENIGGSFDNIPTCEASGETGCVVAYASYAEDKPPGDDARFGVTETEGTEIACTDPASLAGNAGPLSGSYYPLMLNTPAFRTDVTLPEGVETPFLLYRDVLSSRCVSESGASYLEIGTELEAEDPQMPPYRSPIENAGWGLHLTDFNNALEDLLQTVALQAEAGL